MKKFKQLLSNEKGFTLVEILVVIAIIAILFVTLLPQIDNASNRARETGIKTDFHTFQTAAESYLRETSGDGLVIKKFNSFLDPSMEIKTTGVSEKKDPWGNPFDVKVYEDKTTTKLGSAIVVKSGGPDEDLGTTEDNYIFATYYYKGQVGSCTAGFDTNNVTGAFKAITETTCGINMANGTTKIADAHKVS